jgi:hypothetical protein
MNERIRELAEQCWEERKYGPAWFNQEKFAQLIVMECINQALEEKVSEEEIDREDDIEDRCYLRGNNGGIVDAVIRIRQHFGIEP